MIEEIYARAKTFEILKRKWWKMSHFIRFNAIDVVVVVSLHNNYWNDFNDPLETALAYQRTLTKKIGFNANFLLDIS